MVTAVNWQLLSKAIEFYQTHGFEYVEVPWTVPKDILMATCPLERWIVDSTIGGLVGSAEQSFIHMRQNEGLPPGNYVACTPCFRNEDRIDELHQRSFMKVELYASSDFRDGEIDEMLHLANAFFRSVTSPIVWPEFKTVQTDKLSFDIECRGVEIGSYGFRSFQGIDWIYGTGIAEPRFSKSVELAT